MARLVPMFENIPIAELTARERFVRTKQIPADKQEKLLEVFLRAHPLEKVAKSRELFRQLFQTVYSGSAAGYLAAAFEVGLSLKELITEGITDPSGMEFVEFPLVFDTVGLAFLESSNHMHNNFVLLEVPKSEDCELRSRRFIAMGFDNPLLTELRRN